MTKYLLFCVIEKIYGIIPKDFTYTQLNIDATIKTKVWYANKSEKNENKK